MKILQQKTREQLKQLLKTACERYEQFNKDEGLRQDQEAILQLAAE